MNFRFETSRSEKDNALSCAKSLFKDKISGNTDALFTDASRSHVIAFSDLPVYAPICMHLINDEDLKDFFSAYSNEDLLIRKESDGFYLYGADSASRIAEELQEKIRKVYDRVYSSPGRINENGELEIDANASGMVVAGITNGCGRIAWQRVR